MTPVTRKPNHCPACASLDRWALVWAERRARSEQAASFTAEDATMDVHERAGWITALVQFFYVGREPTEEEVAHQRSFACAEASARLREQTMYRAEPA